MSDDLYKIPNKGGVDLGCGLVATHDKEGLWFIQCDCNTFRLPGVGEYPWCEHMVEFYEQPIREDQPPLPPDVWITLRAPVPSLATIVHIDDPDDFGFRAVQLTTKQLIEDIEYRLGRIHVRESLGAVVSFVREWVKEWEDLIRAHGCVSTTHKVGHYELGQQSLKYWADIVSIANTGMCRACADLIEASMPEVDY